MKKKLLMFMMLISISSGFGVFSEVYSFEASSYKTVKVSACNLSGTRKKNAKVDVGYGGRKYYAYTNKYGQVTKVTAKEIILQKKKEELSNGRYCKDEAKVSGTESYKYDEGHVIADSLGGTSNAYNITPQASNVNRSGGKQYAIEQKILKAERSGKQVTNFVATVKYANTKTQIPSSYKISFKIDGKSYSYSFSNKYVKQKSSTTKNSSSNGGAIKTNGKDYGTCAAANKVYGSKWKGYKKGYNTEYNYHRDSDGDGWVCGTDGK